jgi:two-component system, OmpR family, response regulator
VPQKRILIVDDEPDQVSMLAMLLEEAGHAVRTATSPLYAMTLAEQFNPEFVFLDLGLPGMDGFEVLRRLRSRFSDARMFAITGRSGAEARSRSLDAGFEDHLVKPVDFAAIEKILAGTDQR